MRAGYLIVPTGGRKMYGGQPIETGAVVPIVPIQQAPPQVPAQQQAQQILPIRPAQLAQPIQPAQATTPMLAIKPTPAPATMMMQAPQQAQPNTLVPNLSSFVPEQVMSAVQTLMPTPAPAPASAPTPATVTAPSQVQMTVSAIPTAPTLTELTPTVPQRPTLMGEIAADENQPIEVSLDQVPTVEPAESVQPMVLTPPSVSLTELTQQVTPGTEMGPSPPAVTPSETAPETDLMAEALKAAPQVEDMEEERPELGQLQLQPQTAVGSEQQPTPDEFEFGEELPPPLTESAPTLTETETEEPMKTPVMTSVDIAAMKQYIKEALEDPNHPYHAELADITCPLCQSHTPTAQKTMFGNLLDTLQEGPEAPQEPPVLAEPTEEVSPIMEDAVPEKTPEPIPTSTPEPRPTVARPTFEATRTAFQKAFDNVFRNQENPVGKAVNRIAGNLTDIQSRVAGLFGFGGTTQTGGSPASRKLDLLMGPRGDVVLQGEYETKRRFSGVNETTAHKAKKAKKTRRHKMVMSGHKNMRFTKRKGMKH